MVGKKSNLGMYECLVALQMTLSTCAKFHLDPRKYGVTKEQWESQGYTEMDFWID